MASLLITGGRVLLPDMSVTQADVLVDQDSGSIVEIGSDLTAEKTLQASNSLVTPGFVNGHSHVPMVLLRGYADDKPLDRWLEEDIWPAESKMTPDDVHIGAKLGLLEMIKSGVTGFADMFFHVPKIVDAVDQAGVRARLGHGIVTTGKGDENAFADVKESLDFALEYDGAANGRISTAFMPHSLVTVGSEYLDDFVPKARAAGIPIHYHANETLNEVTPIVEDYGVRPLDYAADHGMLESQDFVAHGVHVDEHEINLLAEAGTSVIHCPASNMKLASGMAPIQRMRDAGVEIGLGTDGAAANNDLSLLDEGRDAAMLGKLAADDAGAVPAELVVEMMTQGSASALGFHSGVIKEGEPADLAVIDLEKPHLTPQHDLVSHLAYAAVGSDVKHTICDGQILMRDREVLTLGEKSIVDQAQQTADLLLSRVSS
ncbi:amidohydrolase [Natrialba taiwanensis]|uniref:5-methylthioadenosine/S-adenosylhomocysteine deaminase n=1 Tax=Natrialba taiwanensis DSM 12281 TaxID=1230458 RepID=L9ZJE8_9EURY|nr:amidohydrolase [Natrialba taiwanensis]ELY86166.1 amidohydrolase [Natrialba taiwanensis DSM 12281]